MTTIDHIIERDLAELMELPPCDELTRLRRENARLRVAGVKRLAEIVRLRAENDRLREERK